MATQTSPANTPSAQVVGNAFVEQYYHILHQSPQLVHRFYTDSSVLSRPGPDGNMTSVKTMQAIDQVILSLDYKDYKAEIRTIDSQDSYKDGVVVLVTGWLTVKDNVKRKFAQSFFLAPQDKGYFVLNDVFRYVDEYNSSEPNAVPVDDVIESIPQAPVTPDPEPSPVPDHPVSDNTTSAVDVAYRSEEVHEPSDNGEVSVMEAQVLEAPVHSGENEVVPVHSGENEVVPVHSGENEVGPVQDVVSSTVQDVVSSRAQDVVSSRAQDVSSTVQDVVSSTVQDDAPKKSYASIVKVKATSLPVYSAKKAAAANTVKVAVVHADQHSAPASAPVAADPTINNDAYSSSISEEVEGYSIYIRGLPLNASVMQVEDEFKKFGEIRPNGVQVRSNKQGFCFGFVEFVTVESVQSAIAASPITIGGRAASVEEKRTRTRVGPTGRPRFPPGGRTGFRNDSFRGRGNFGGGGRGGYGRSEGGYGRSEYVNRGDFSGRRGGPVGRIGDGYQRVDHNVGNGRVGRQGGGGVSQTAVTA